MTTVETNLNQVRRQIAAACAAAGRSVQEVTLLAVSKTQPAAAVRAAHAAGQSAFGENYVQEALAKMDELADLPLQWHCIGPLQANKTRAVAERFDWAHAIDRLRIAERLSAQRPEHLPPLNVCIQVNVDGGPSKSGLPPHEALPLARAIVALPRLRLRGLMAIPEPQPDDAAARAVFARVAATFAQVRAALAAEAAPGQGASADFDTLSMGMSADLAPAIAAGSTLVRVGTALFGARPRPVK